MLRLFILALVWLMGSAPAWGATGSAAPQWFTQGETLQYRVYWGPLSLGKATLSYQPASGGYQVQAHVKGSLVFFSLDDTWSATGKVTGGRLQPGEYRAIQAENDYRANKRLTFHPQKHTMLYENLRGGEPSLTVPLPAGGQDPFSALYDLRRQPLPARTETREVMGLKRPFTLTISAPVTEQRNGESLQKVTLVKTDPAKPGTDTWHIWLAGEEHVPVRIVAELKAGSFRAELIPATGRAKVSNNKTYGVDE